jgi:hypothetical protein
MALLDYFKKCTKKRNNTPSSLINEDIDTVSIPTGEEDLQNCNNVRKYYSAVGVPYLYGEGDEKIDPIEMFKDLIDEWDNDGFYTGVGSAGETKYPIGHQFDTYDETGCQFVDQAEFLEYLDVPEGTVPVPNRRWEDEWLPEIDENLKPVGFGRWNYYDICWEESLYPLEEFLEQYYSGTPESDFWYANLIYQKFYETNDIYPYTDLQPYYENALNAEYTLVNTNQGCFDNITEQDFIELKTPNFTPYLHDFQGWGRTSNVNVNGETCEWDWKKIAIAGLGVYLVFKVL